LTEAGDDDYAQK